MIRVCDCMMGSGKSSACINYMNEHPEQKYIYITPYTDEADRVVKACPGLWFYEPSNKNKESGYTKSGDTAALIADGKNIASTHQCFMYYTPDMLEDIRKNGYILMIDENVAVLEECNDTHPADIEMALRGNYITIENGFYKLTDTAYDGGWAKSFFRLLKSRQLMEVDAQDKVIYYWALPEDLLTAFKDVVIMTYLFEGTDMYYYLRMRGIEYENICIVHDESGYHFANGRMGVTDDMRNLINKIHICQKPSLNAIGEDYYSLSKSWHDKKDNDTERMRKNLSNWFTNDNRGMGKNKRLWAYIGKSYGNLRSAGVWDNGLVFNTRATNDYATRTVLAYPVNVFVNVDKKKYYAKNGLVFDEDRYSLSTMIQWIWRSAIRNGEDIQLYVPSRRMRELLQKWLDGLASGRDWATLPDEGRCDICEEEVLQLPVG